MAEHEEQKSVDEFDGTDEPWRPEAEELDDQAIERGVEVEADAEAGGRLRHAEPAEEEGSEGVDEQADLTLEETVGGGQAESDESGEGEQTLIKEADEAAGEAEEQAEMAAEDVTAEDEAERAAITTESVVEAVLFATNEPVTPNKLAEIVGTGTVKDMRQMVEDLNARYEQMKCAFRIEAIAGGYQMLTRPVYNVWLGKLLKVRSETKLSTAALETLAIIAYKQPIMRVDIEAIRGVACGEMVRQLCDKGLVKIVGRAEELGRPLLYGTTKKFLEVFGLHSLKDLPTAEDLKAPD